MEAMRIRLEEAMKKNERVKIIFQYPSTDRAVIKSGFVKETYGDGFVLNEKFDGVVVYSYGFIVEIRGVVE